MKMYTALCSFNVNFHAPAKNWQFSPRNQSMFGAARTPTQLFAQYSTLHAAASILVLHVVFFTFMDFYSIPVSAAAPPPRVQVSFLKCWIILLVLGTKNEFFQRRRGEKRPWFFKTFSPKAHICLLLDTFKRNKLVLRYAIPLTV